MTEFQKGNLINIVDILKFRLNKKSPMMELYVVNRKLPYTENPIGTFDKVTKIILVLDCDKLIFGVVLVSNPHTYTLYRII